MQKRIDWNDVVKALPDNNGIFSSTQAIAYINENYDRDLLQIQIHKALSPRKDIETVFFQGVYYYRVTSVLSYEEFIHELRTPVKDPIRPDYPRFDVMGGPTYAVLKRGKFPSDVDWTTYDDPDSAYEALGDGIDAEQATRSRTYDDFFFVKIEKHVRVPFNWADRNGNTREHL